MASPVIPPAYHSVTETSRLHHSGTLQSHTSSEANSWKDENTTYGTSMSGTVPLPFRLLPTQNSSPCFRSPQDQQYSPFGQASPERIITRWPDDEHKMNYAYPGKLESEAVSIPAMKQGTNGDRVYHYTAAQDLSPEHHPTIHGFYQFADIHEQVVPTRALMPQDQGYNRFHTNIVAQLVLRRDQAEQEEKKLEDSLELNNREKIESLQLVQGLEQERDRRIYESPSKE
ncbi:hypothetical protein SUNI508_00181 [Seiridium unicorne]|uniref:Uncharacterized protein n=1 Tax=Seiridium unicorne TaxID=138068 RepID=A0ABR2VII2_9PEZI